MKIKEKLSKNSILKTYLLILIPIMIILIFVAAVIFSYSKNYRNIIKESYTSMLTMVCDRTEDTVTNLTNVIQMLAWDSDFMSVLTKQEVDVTQRDIFEATRTLNSLKDRIRGIDSAFVVNRVQQIEYGTMGTYPLGEFFDDVYKYTDYSYSYWKYYQAPVTDMQILPPSTVTKFAGNENVIPMVFTHIGDDYLSSLLIVNIKVADLFDTLEDNKMTDNSFFYIINKQLKRAYTKSSVSEYEFDNEFYDTSIYNLDADFEMSLEGDKYMVVSHSPFDSVLGYAYVAFVPDSDIKSVTFSYFWIVGVLGILVLAVVFFVVGVSVQEIYKPINIITKKISRESDIKGTEAESKDPLMRLNKMIDYMQSENDELHLKIESSLPLIQERNLITLLNQNEHYAESVSEILLNETLKGFKYDKFCSVIICFSPTNKFYNEYNDSDYTKIFSGLRFMVKNIFSEKFETYMIPCEVADAIYILLNPDSTDKKEEILDILEEIKNILEVDSSYVTVNSACGGIYTGIKGMRRSHREVMKEISGKTELESMHIEIKRDKNMNRSVLFKPEDRGYLADLLILGKTGEALEFIKKILLDNLRSNVSDEQLVALNKEILKILLKVIRAGEIEFETGKDGDDKFTDELSEDSVENVLEVINKMIGAIEEKSSESGKVDIHAIALYIDFHFKESDCSVEKTAEVFGTGAKYISQKFKDVMGMNFTEYLSRIRIRHSKDLLINTNMSISQVGEEVGYPIKSTFIRAFKRIEDISPTEFRSNLKRNDE